MRALLFLTSIMNGLAQTPQITLRVDFMSPMVQQSDARTVYYELHVANQSIQSIELERLQVIGKNKSTLFTLEGKDLQTAISAAKVILSPNDSIVVYLEMPLPKSREAIALYHMLSVKDLSNNKLFEVASSPIKLNPKQPAMLNAPLKSGIWVAIYHPTWVRGHRRVFYKVDGRQRIPGRFAVDFIQVDSLGRYAHGNEDEIKQWYGYGADVLAVADGEIVSVLDSFPEVEKVSQHPRYPAKQATGNYITLKIADSLYVFYEHLKPGSIQVKEGQQVKQGDVIARLGFTGQTTGPHLHFHVANRNSPLGAEGVPFVFERFKQLGVYSSFESFGKKKWDFLPKKRPIRKQRPMPNAVIQFE